MFPDVPDVATGAGGAKSKEVFFYILMFLSDVPVVAIVGSVALGVFLVIAVIIVLYICKRLTAKKLAESAANVDENPTYGDYYDPDPVMEVEDNNVYYSTSSDYSTIYEAGLSRTTANNSLYGS